MPPLVIFMITGGLASGPAVETHSYNSAPTLLNASHSASMVRQRFDPDWPTNFWRRGVSLLHLEPSGMIGQFGCANNSTFCESAA